MKKIIPIFILAVILFSGCAVTTEKYRFQTRLDHYYRLLNNSEKEAFRKGDYQTAGLSVDARISSDNAFKLAWTKLQQDEAITTFDGPQSIHFFYFTLLKELNRTSYLRFMGFLDAQGQTAFVKKEGIVPIVEKLMITSHEFKGLMESVKTEYRMNGFSNEEIVQFFRDVEFPEVSRREVFNILKILKSVNALEDFKSGNTDLASRKTDAGMKQNIAMSYELDRIKDWSGLTKIDTKTFLELYYRVVIREMDPYALSRTMEKF